MRQNERDKRNYIIGGLLVLVMFMTIGFAAFRTALNINGTASITSNWCVGFDNRNTEAYQITKGVSAGTNPTGEISFSGTACSTNYVPNSTLTANFYQPGDKIEYTLTIANKSSMAAAIESIEVNGNDVTSNQTITDGNIIWKVYMPETTTLASNATTTMKVSAEFQNTTDISNMIQGDSSRLTVGINVVQDDGSGGMDITPTKFTGDVYAWNTEPVTIGTSTINDLASTNTSQPYYRSAAEVMSASGYPYFNKYTIVNDIITEGYSCQTFGISEFEPECLKMSTDGSTYGNETTGNIGILKALSTNDKFTGSCYLSSGGSSCNVGSLYLGADSDGSVNANGNSSTDAHCRIRYNGDAKCFKW